MNIWFLEKKLHFIEFSISVSVIGICRYDDCNIGICIGIGRYENFDIGNLSVSADKEKGIIGPISVSAAASGNN